MHTDNMWQILISGKPEFAQDMVQTKNSSAIFLLSVCFKIPCTFLVNDGPFAPAVLCPGKYILAESVMVLTCVDSFPPQLQSEKQTIKRQHF